ncbi:Threonine/homoserine efflux transporter RhtA [Desulfotomaculum arcticum]|uniref:Threonine/homoserine efflux transporter RhtA n=1 Tax=Desulfotruncus arcticus DSM 17038 TaxID=1121424 RepID=A0A1I2ZUE7_9FIRM|nr:Threonine/homoserine efflux transporter RhtA [Desulfotomaculum arcticum] [Desulfotruncus arcticus DSM 17038]
MVNLCFSMIFSFLCQFKILNSAIGSPFTFSALRFIIGGVLLVGLTLALRMGVPAREDWLALVVLGLLQTTLTFGLVFYAMQSVPAGITSVLLYSYPIIVNLMAYFLLGERLNLKNIVGLLTGFSGLIIIFSTDGFQSGSIYGKILIIIAAINWGLATVFLRRRFPTHNKLQVTAWQMFFGGVLTLLIVPFIEGGISLSLVTAWAALLFTSVFASAMAFSLWFYVLDFWGVGRASVFIFLVPVCGVFFATLLLGEDLTIKLALGLIAVVIGIWLVNAAAGKKSNSNEHDSSQNLLVES